MDIFAAEAVWLGKLQCCVLSHDADRAGQGWFCESIIVREGPTPTHEYVFPCHRCVFYDVKYIIRIVVVTELFDALILLVGRLEGHLAGKRRPRSRWID